MSILSSIVHWIHDAIEGALSSPSQEEKLDKLASASSEKLDWRNSIVDLMKLTGQDSSYHARKSLAEELGEDNYTGTAAQNIALHQKVLDRLR